MIFERNLDMILRTDVSTVYKLFGLIMKILYGRGTGSIGGIDLRPYELRIHYTSIRLEYSLFLQILTKRPRLKSQRIIALILDNGQSVDNPCNPSILFRCHTSERYTS